MRMPTGTALLDGHGVWWPSQTEMRDVTDPFLLFAPQSTQARANAFSAT